MFSLEMPIGFLSCSIRWWNILLHQKYPFYFLHPPPPHDLPNNAISSFNFYLFHSISFSNISLEVFYFFLVSFTGNPYIFVWVTFHFYAWKIHLCEIYHTFNSVDSSYRPYRAVWEGGEERFESWSIFICRTWISVLNIWLTLNANTHT